jgi:integrase
MPRLVHKLPIPRLHTPSGRARIRLGKIDYWLGRYGSPEAQREYDRIIGEWLTNQRQLPSVLPQIPHTPIEPTREVTVTRTMTVGDLITRFLQWSETYYIDSSGRQTREHQNFLHVLQPLQKKFSSCPVSEFGPARLLEFRQDLIKRNLARRTINAMIRRLRQVWRFGVSRELVPLSAYQSLQTLESLQPGRGGKETSGSRGSVPWETVSATLPFLPELVQAFVVVAYHTGARVGELAKLTTGMINRNGEVWVANLSQHKNSYRGKSRRIFIGPNAQTALQPFLLESQPDEPIFSPLRVDERQIKRRGKKLPGKTYSRCGLSQCLKRAIDRAGVEHWTLAQLRHSAAVRITDSFDIETTRQVLGHSNIAMSRHSASGSEYAAKESAKKIG